MKKEDVEEQRAPAATEAQPTAIIRAIVAFLQMFMTETLAKRLVGMVLISAGVSNTRVAESTGLSDRSVRTLRKAIADGELDSLFIVGHGSGRVRKTKGFESAIVEELEANNYHTRQQVADMIQEKFGICLSVSAVGRLLKKTASGG